MTKEELQFDLLKTELELTQGQMDKYDQLSAKTRAWVVTIWATSVGWFVQIQKKEVLFLGIFIAVVFWILDAMLKNFREDYKQRRNDVAEILSELFRTQTLPDNVYSPNLPSHDRTAFLKKLFRPHIFPLYTALILVNLVLFLST